MTQENNFSERLQQLIDKIGWKQETLALKVGRSEGTISRWINSTSSKMPSKTSVNAICQVTGCNLEWLREGKGPMFPPEKAPRQVSISGIDYQIPPQHPQGISTEPEQQGGYAAQDFRRICIGMFEPIIEYIAERYGTKPSDVERFKTDFTEHMNGYRRWLYFSEEEKKRGGDCPEDTTTRKASG